MRQILLLLLLCGMTALSSAQNIGIGVFQDAKLAFFEDDYGNTPYTADIRIEFALHGFELWGLGRTVIGGTYEYADLAGGKYQRWGAQGGFAFDYVGPFKVTPMVGAGIINRMSDTQGYISLEASVDVEYFIIPKLSAGFKSTLTQRGDLWTKYQDRTGSYRPWDWRRNFYIGIKYYLD